jgi:hypothetical protein
MRNIVGALTALSLMAVPVAATAGTRASDVVPAAAKADRATPAAKKKALDAVGALPIIIGVVTIATAVVIITSDDDDDGLTDG